MCVIFLAINKHPKYKFIAAANRDEFYDRPTANANFWEDSSNILAGRDLVHKGTWLGISKNGRFAAVTNFRDPNQSKGIHSRGNLVKDFLISLRTPAEFLHELQPKASEYTGFNLIVGDTSGDVDVRYFGNRGEGIHPLKDGYFGLSNHLLETPWHKVKDGKAQFINSLTDISSEGIFDILSDQTLACDSELPNTGIGIERERLLSPIFIETPIYGTRCSTLVLVKNNGETTFIERNYNGNPSDFTDSQFDF